LIGDWESRTCIQVCSRSKVPTDVARGSGFGIEVISKFVRGMSSMHVRGDVIGNTAVDRKLPLLQAARVFRIPCPAIRILTPLRLQIASHGQIVNF
jgi:hypothetical protein